MLVVTRVCVIGVLELELPSFVVWISTLIGNLVELGFSNKTACSKIAESKIPRHCSSGFLGEHHHYFCTDS